MGDKKKSMLEQCVLTIVIAFGLGAIGSAIRTYYFAFLEKVDLGPGINRAFLYLGHLCFLLTFIVYALAVKKDAKYFTSGLQKKSWIGAVLGLITGFMMMGACIAAASASGNIVVGKPSGTISIFPFIFGAFAILIQASTEEIETRGFVFSRLFDIGASGRQAILISSIYFAALHLSKPGFGLIPILTLSACGLVYVLSYYYFGSIWFACANHMMWNFTQDYLFGLPNSGTPSEFSLMNTKIVSSGFCYNETFGIEGSWFSVLVSSASALIVFAVGRYYKSKTHKEFSV